MRVFIMCCFRSGAGYNVQMAFNADTKPCMPAIMKWLGNRVKTNDIFVKSGTYFKIHDVDSYMIKYSFWLRNYFLC